MRNIKLIIEYDGTNYAGWQRQNNAVTIQQKVEESIVSLTGEKIAVIGSSRTDAGVHARGFCANFFTNSTIPPHKFKDAINSKLSEDIVIIDSEEVSLNFHARYSSTGKRYSYTILNREQPPAIDRRYVYYYKKLLDYESMKNACKYFIGTHDFSAFKSTGSSVKTSIRTINGADLIKAGDKIIFYVEGDGFLYNMVRIMAGTLINVGTGEITPSRISDIINSKDRTKAGKTAPAKGLCLEVVYYN
ncbi:tRNA pseudouridine synthase A [Clostridiales bacterium oral taxon 876 str. F0540]|nr:tRNA pseudouridine synthase A [Clostridiales bacterium oral taxon 876 str. F0540]